MSFPFVLVPPIRLNSFFSIFQSSAVYVKDAPLPFFLYSQPSATSQSDPEEVCEWSPTTSIFFQEPDVAS